MRAVDLAKSDLWWKGPDFLRKPRHKWPEQPRIRASEEAAAEVRMVEEFTKNIIMMRTSEATGGPVLLIHKLLKKGVSIRKAMRGLVRLCEMLNDKFKRVRFEWTFERLQEVWIRQEQEIAFPELYKELKDQKMVTKLRELDPRIDSHGIIRVSSGLARSLYHSWETVFPILLHEKMPYVKELKEYTHSKCLGHTGGGGGTLLNHLRKNYHTVGGKKGAVKTIQNCFPCAKKTWKPLTRKLPEFHGSRLGNFKLRAFAEIGIDHAGPFQLRQGRSTVEGYILVIACCATRAVNLEMSLSTGADFVLAALQRHVGAFGAPDYINSDLGTGFVKAKRLIKEKAEMFTTEGWDNVGNPKWHTNVPYSPTWSSHVEAMVKITKEALKRLRGKPCVTRLTADEFYAQLKRAQGYINMRPLLQVSIHHLPLTPADFMGTGATWLTSFVMEPENRGASGHRFQQLEEMRKDLWRRFKEEYLMWLRRQGGSTKGLPEIGDLVLVSEVPSWKGNGWPVGKIVGVKTGSDEPRVYEIEIIPTEELQRPPQLINKKVKSQLKKKVIMRNYRKIGMLPKTKLDTPQEIPQPGDHVVDHHEV